MADVFIMIVHFLDSSFVTMNKTRKLLSASHPRVNVAAERSWYRINARGLGDDALFGS